jgi:hypothetical protein
MTRSALSPSPKNRQPVSGQTARGRSSPIAGRQARQRTFRRRVRRFEAALTRFNLRPRPIHVRPLADLVKNTAWSPSKVVSCLLLSAAIVLIGLVHTQDEWFLYAEDVHFNQLSYLEPGDLYQLSQVEGWNTLWVQPEDIRRRILENPYVEDVNLRLQLPARLEVSVQEHPPVAIWQTQAGDFWIASNGATLPVKGQVDASLPRIVDMLQEARLLGAPDAAAGPSAVDPRVLTSAMALMETMPELENKVRFNRSVGLNFPLPDKEIWVYWGDGKNTTKKLSNLTAVRQVLDDGETAAQIIDVRFVNRPYFR